VKNEDLGVFTVAKQIDDKYRRMLVFNDYNLRNKGFYINLNGLMARIMGQRQMNSIVKLDNGHLASENRVPPDITLAVTQLSRFNNALNEKGKSFVFVLAPYKVPKFEDILPAGYINHRNQNADDLVFALKENNVPVLDLRDELFNEGISNTDAFFITDHHWKPETGFWAYKKIIDTLQDNGLFDPIDPLYTDLDEYNVEVYRDFFLGSAGKKTGTYYAGVDDFSIITPKFSTDISITIPSSGIDKRGEFFDTVFDMSEFRFDFFTSNPHAIYGYNTAGFIEYRNEIAPVDLKVLAIGESFCNIPYTFLPLVFSEVDKYDLRNFKGDFTQQYMAFDPDVVIILVNPTAITGTNTAYDFLNDINEEEIDIDPSQDGEE